MPGFDVATQAAFAEVLVHRAQTTPKSGAPAAPDAIAIKLISGQYYVVDNNTTTPDAYAIKIGSDYYLDTGASSGLPLSYNGTDFFIEG